MDTPHEPAVLTAEHLDCPSVSYPIKKCFQPRIHMSSDIMAPIRMFLFFVAPDLWVLSLLHGVLISR